MGNRNLWKRLIAWTLALSISMTWSMAADPRPAAFPDMPDDWSTPALTAAVENGLLQGKSGKLSPGDLLTRAEMATMLGRAFGGEKAADLSSFADVKPSDWYYAALARAVQMGAFRGSDGRLEPDRTITRQEAFVVLARVFALEAENSAALTAFRDGDQVADWSRTEIAAMVDAGYLHGSGGMLNPLDGITRAEFAQVMHNLVAAYLPGPESDRAGNVIVRAPGATLRNRNIEGDLIIGDGAGGGSVILTGVHVSGRLLVRGGLTSVVLAEGTTVAQLTLIAEAEGSSVQVERGSTVTQATIAASGVVLSGGGKVSAVAVLGNGNRVNIAGARVTAAPGATGTTANGRVVAPGTAITVPSLDSIPDELPEEDTTLQPQNLHSPVEAKTDTMCTILWDKSGDYLTHPQSTDTYNVYMNGSDTPVNPAPVARMGYSLSDLTPDTQYTFTVKSVRKDGSVSKASNTISVRTKPASTVLDVTKAPYNAKGDGTMVETALLQQAIDDAAALYTGEDTNGGTVLLPVGYTFVSGPLHLKSHISLCIDGTLLGSPNLADYGRTISVFEGWVVNSYESLLTAGKLDTSPVEGANPDKSAGVINNYDTQITDIAIFGSGIVNGYGYIDGITSGMDAIQSTSAANLNPGMTNGAIRSRGHTLDMMNAKNVYIRGVGELTGENDAANKLTFSYGPSWTTHFIFCENVTYDSVSLISKNSAGRVRNGDGIDPESSVNTNIFNCYFHTGDDSIAIKSGKNLEGEKRAKPTKNVRITDVVIDGSNGGICIGSEMSGGVENVLVQNYTQKGSLSWEGLDIKSNVVRGGYVRNVAYKDVVLNKMNQTAIRISLQYNTNNDGTPATAGPAISNISYENIRVDGTGGKDALWIKGVGPDAANSPDGAAHYITDVRMKNVSLKGANGATIDWAKDCSFEDVTINGNNVNQWAVTNSEGLAGLRAPWYKRDYDAINTQIAKTETMTRENFETEADWSELNAALTAAKGIVANPDAVQSAIDDACQRLAAACAKRIVEGYVNLVKTVLSDAEDGSAKILYVDNDKSLIAFRPGLTVAELGTQLKDSGDLDLTYAVKDASGAAKTAGAIVVGDQITASAGKLSKTYIAALAIKATLANGTLVNGVPGGTTNNDTEGGGSTKNINYTQISTGKIGASIALKMDADKAPWSLLPSGGYDLIVTSKKPSGTSGTSHRATVNVTLNNVSVNSALNMGTNPDGYGPAGTPTGGVYVNADLFGAAACKLVAMDAGTMTLTGSLNELAFTATDAYQYVVESVIFVPKNNLADTEYSVTYYLNGGAGTVPTEGGHKAGVKFSAAPGTGLTAPAGKEFKEWNTKANGTGTAYAADAEITMPGRDLTLYAMWADKASTSFSLTYDRNGGTGTAPVPETLASGAAFTAATSAGLTAPLGKTFKEWNTNADGSGTAYAPGAQGALPGHGLTLYAVWQGSGSEPEPVDTRLIPAPAGAQSVGSIGVNSVNFVNTTIRSIAIDDVLSGGSSDKSLSRQINKDDYAGTVGRLHILPTADEAVRQLAAEDGGSLTYAVYAKGTQKHSEKIADGDNLVVTAQSGATKNYTIHVGEKNANALTGRLELRRDSIVAGKMQDVRLDYYAGQRSANATVEISVPAGVNVTMDNTTVDLIGRGEVKLADFATQSVGRVATDYTYQTVGQVEIQSRGDGGQVIRFTGLDLRPQNGVDLRIVIKGVTIATAGDYAFNAKLTASTASGGPIAASSTGLASEQTVLHATNTISDLARVQNLSLVYDEATHDYAKLPLSFTAPNGAASVSVEQSLDKGATWTNVAATISGGTATVSGLARNTLYQFRLNVTGGANAGISNTVTYYSGMYDVKLAGAKGDGISNDTPAINAAIAYLNSIGGGTLEFTAGTYMVGTILLKSNVYLYVDADATIKGSKNLYVGGVNSLLDPENAWWSYADYGSGTSDNSDPYENPENFLSKQDDGHCFFQNSMFYAMREDNIKILGTGYLDGNGSLATGDGTVRGAANNGARTDKMFAMKLCTNIEIGGDTVLDDLSFDLKNDLPYLHANDIQSAAKPYYKSLENDSDRYSKSLNQMLKINRGGHFATLFTGCDGVNLHDIYYGPTNARDVFDFMETGNVSAVNIFALRTSDDIIKPGSDCALGYTKPAHNFNFRNVLGNSNCNPFQIGSETADDIQDLYLDNFQVLGANKCGFSISTNDGGHVGNLWFNYGKTGYMKPGYTKEDIAKINSTHSMLANNGEPGTAYFERTKTPIFVSISGRNRVMGAKYVKPSGAPAGLITNVPLGSVFNINIQNVTMREAYGGSGYNSTTLSSYYPYNPSSHDEFTSVIVGYELPSAKFNYGVTPPGDPVGYIDGVTIKNVSELVKGYNSGAGKGDGPEGQHTFAQTKAVPNELLPGKYNSPDMGVRPSYGYYIRHSKNITLDTADMSYEGTPVGRLPDERYPIVVDDVQGLMLKNVTMQVADTVSDPAYGLVKSIGSTGVTLEGCSYARETEYAATADSGYNTTYKRYTGPFSVIFKNPIAVTNQTMADSLGGNPVILPLEHAPLPISLKLTEGTTKISALDNAAKTITVNKDTTVGDLLSGVESANALALTYAVTTATDASKTSNEALVTGDKLVASADEESRSVTYTITVVEPPSELKVTLMLVGSPAVSALDNTWVSRTDTALRVTPGATAADVLAGLDLVAMSAASQSELTATVTDAGGVELGGNGLVVDGCKLVLTSALGTVSFPLSPCVVFSYMNGGNVDSHVTGKNAPTAGSEKTTGFTTVYYAQGPAKAVGDWMAYGDIALPTTGQYRVSFVYKINSNNRPTVQNYLDAADVVGYSAILGGVVNMLATSEKDVTPHYFDDPAKQSNKMFLVDLGVKDLLKETLYHFTSVVTAGAGASSNIVIADLIFTYVGETTPLSGGEG